MPEPVGSVVDRTVIDELIEATGGDPSFLGELIEAYRTDAPAQLAAMREAVAAGSPGDLVRPVHTLKSSSASLGALGLAERCRSLEAQARSGSLEGGVDATEAIAGELEHVLAELSGLMGTS
jgi:HPt (histidine-containing phosphotransfer) domain-containing protein